MNRRHTGLGLLSALALTMGAPAAMGALSASTVLAYSATTPEVSAPTSVASTYAVLPAGEEVRAPSTCVYAFSKDTCDGRLAEGVAERTECGETCQTVKVTDAVWHLPMRSNQTGCSSDGRCDESQEKDGRLWAKVDYVLRFNDPCRFRGCVTSTYAEYQAQDGTVYQGTLSGTLGVGTHRQFSCPLYGRQRDCERCLDVEFFYPPIAPSGVWRLGVELTFHGYRADGVIGDELCFSISGDLYTDGAPDGPFDVTNWRYAGTADGTHLAPCLTP